MARGVPVACSDRASLPEVAGGAARLFDPERPRAIADAIEALLSDPDEAGRLRRGGTYASGRAHLEETARATAASTGERFHARAVVGAATVSSERRKRELVCVAAEPAAVDSRRPRLPRRRGRSPRRGRPSGDRRGDEAVHAVLDELGRGVVGAGDDDARGARSTPPRRRRGRSPRAATAARGRAPRRAPARPARPARSRGRRRPPRGPRARRGGAPRAVRGRRRGSRSGGPGIRSRARAIAGTSAGTRFSGMCRPAKTTVGGSAAGTSEPGPPAYWPRSTVSSPRKPSSRRRRSCSREKQNARWGMRRHSCCTRQPTAPPDAAEVLAPVLPRPDLVPVDDEAVARAGGAARRPRAARSTETRPCVPRRSDGRASRGARTRRARTGAAARSAGARRARRAACSGPTAITRTPGTPASSPSGHCRSVR